MIYALSKRHSGQRKEGFFTADFTDYTDAEGKCQ
jgi:hypothetical protein